MAIVVNKSKTCALVLASGDDVVCVPREIDAEYLGFLSAVGVGPSAANVLAGTITSAPGVSPEARSARRSASSPLETPTQWSR